MRESSDDRKVFDVFAGTWHLARHARERRRPACTDAFAFATLGKHSRSSCLKARSRCTLMQARAPALPADACVPGGFPRLRCDNDGSRAC